MTGNCYWKHGRIYTVWLVLVLLLNWSCSNDNDFENGGQEPGPGEEPVQTEFLPLIEIVSSSKIVDEPKVRSTLKITEQGKVT